MIKHTLLLCLLALFCIPEYAAGQVSPQNTILYRGPIALQLPFRYNGSIYAYEDAFSVGELWYNNKHYKDVLLNLDAYRDELYLKQPGGGQPLVLEKELVDRFTLREKVFIHILKNTEIKNLPAGFYQVLYTGQDTLFKQIRQKYSSRPADVDSRGVFNFFELNYSYVLIKEGRAHPFKSTGYLKKLYKEKNTSIKKFIRTLPPAVKKEDPDKFMTSILQLIEGTL